MTENVDKGKTQWESEREIERGRKEEGLLGRESQVTRDQSQWPLTANRERWGTNDV